MTSSYFFIRMRVSQKGKGTCAEERTKKICVVIDRKERG